MNLNRTIVVKKENFLKGVSKEVFVQNLVQLIKDQVLEAYIFGSFFSERFNCDSDLDLILVMETKEDFIMRPLLFPNLYELNIPLDLLVYTPEEFSKIKTQKNSGFWKSVFLEIKKII